MTVGRHGVETCLGIQLWSEESRHPLLQESDQSIARGHLRLECPRLRRGYDSTDILTSLGCDLAIDRETVKLLLITPNPDWKPVWRELPQVRSREIRHLFLRHREPPVDAEICQQSASPGSSRDNNMPCREDSVVGHYLDRITY